MTNDADVVWLLPRGHVDAKRVYKRVLRPAAGAATETAATTVSTLLENDAAASASAEPPPPPPPPALVPPPAKGERVAIHYQLFVAAADTEYRAATADATGRVRLDGTYTTDDDRRAAPFTFVMGRSHVIPAVELALATMRPGELARVHCGAPACAFGVRGRRGADGTQLVRPNCGSVEIDIEYLGTVRPNGTMTAGVAAQAPAGESAAAAAALSPPPALRYRKTRPFTELNTAAEREAYAKEAKELGNYYFKQGNWEAALQEYQVALQSLRLAADMEEEQEEQEKGEAGVAEREREALVQALWNNLARTHYRMGAYADSARCADAVIEARRGNAAAEVVISPDTDANTDAEASTRRNPSVLAKALFTRAQARTELGEYEAARQDLLQVMRLEPNHSAVRTQLDKVQRLREAYRDKERSTFGGMFAANAPATMTTSSSSTAAAGAPNKVSASSSTTTTRTTSGVVRSNRLPLLSSASSRAKPTVRVGGSGGRTPASQ
ncbi:hypothetical protein CDCA_CDCA05G1631 [Cyanidium caldarium]|uniref:peptidylprolyl isomerase n=1 Tax=Cyanidium caldarium TaxID=2771 RepID=A0AAV9IU30_CYACA|nr:hypothetical protein CDCA_CDCA05G1631 [Cyanidium caldarium]